MMLQSSTLAHYASLTKKYSLSKKIKIKIKITVIPIVVGAFGMYSKILKKKYGGFENQKNRDYRDHSIVKIG